jgi:hypothetical protein
VKGRRNESRRFVIRHRPPRGGLDLGIASGVVWNGGIVMSIRRLLVACAVALAASMSASYAGPCSHEIDRLQAAIDTRLNANAAAGPDARESTAATMHRQPTPSSIAAAEGRLGDVSPQKLEAVAAAMARARDADGAGNQSACEQALADVRRALGP